MTGGLVQIGKYRLLRPVGRGAMGTVYLGYDPFTDRQVAVKVAHREAPGGTDGARLYRKLFFNETRTAGLLRHPNIVTVYDAGEEGDDYYIVMEYVPGGSTLDPWCRGGALLAPDEVAGIVFKCAEALDYSHRKGVVHRDIKPGNILLGDGRRMVKVADFGIALLLDPSISDTQLLAPAGSPLYMSPEQIREQPLTGQSDLFSLGAVMYEMLTGEPAFAATTFAGVTRRILEEEPVPVRELRPDVPEPLARIVERAIQKSPGRRYASAWDLAADLGLAFSELERPRDGVLAEDRVAALKTLEFFLSFPDAEIWELLRFSRWEELPPGTTVLSEGEEGEALYIVVCGEVSVRKGGAEVARLGAGQCFGEMAWLARRRRSASVCTVDQTTLLRISAAGMEQTSESCQLQFQKVFINTLVDRLVQTTDALTRLRR